VVASLVDLKERAPMTRYTKASQRRGSGGQFRGGEGIVGAQRPGRKSPSRSHRARGETKSGFFTKQKRDAMRLMHTPKPMFIVM